MSAHRIVMAPLVVALAAGSAHAAFEACPPELRLDAGPRTIFLGDRFMNKAQYQRTKWAPGHHRPVDAGFARPPETAIAAVLAIEARHGEVVPAPYRQALAAAPRDATLRLKMARCELREDTTLRRGIYDALMAYLIARDDATAKQVEPLLDRATMTSDATEHISPAEADIEDALSHAALPPALKLKSPLADVAAAVAGRLVHHCGAELCTFRRFEGKPRLLRSDVRDHGYSAELVLSPAQKRAACHRDTGYDSRRACQAACHVGAVKRYHDNERAMGVGDDEEERCKSLCERSCP